MCVILGVLYLIQKKIFKNENYIDIVRGIHLYTNLHIKIQIYFPMIAAPPGDTVSEKKEKQKQKK